MPVVPSPGAQPTDIITLAEAKQAIGSKSSDTTNDTLMQLIVSAISDELDKLCGPVVQRTITGEVHDGGPGPAFTNVGNNATAWDRVDNQIFLNSQPVQSVTSVTEYTGTTAATLTAETNTAQTATDYLFDPVNGTVRRRANGGDLRWVAGRANIVVTYVAGRFADTASVAPRFKAAAGITFAHVWRSQHGAGNQTFGAGELNTYGPVGFLIPNQAKELLAGDLNVFVFA